jgi:hypothetical protein
MCKSGKGETNLVLVVEFAPTGKESSVEELSGKGRMDIHKTHASTQSVRR